MRKISSIASLLTVVCLLTWVGCGAPSRTLADKEPGDAKAFAGILQAVAVMNPTEGNKAGGWVKFVEKDGKVTITAEITGLTPNQKHAIHIHEFGDMTTKDGTGTGGHYNPEGHKHALPEAGERHAGDLGNLQADADGKAALSLTVDNISVAGAKNPVLGRGVIIHAKPDDGGQPVGNAGARISQGAIGIAKVAQPAK